MSQLFGPVRQIGYVVRDIEAAMKHWTGNMHIGPFYYVPRVPYMDFSHGDSRATPEMSLAIAYSGNTQIELLQQHDDTPTSYRKFLMSGHEGLHHIGFFTGRLEHTLHRATEAGLEVEQSIVTFDQAGAAVYFRSNGHAGTGLKLVALHAGNADLYRMIQAEAERWDGSGPIRCIED
ncbi:VOC family protein [Azoarcus sp. KH32C]|uniref:VOC family protein n=1 Tax=Azoarcus sp. KH32C TaxID=748247 RepID=UPI0002386941|nr:VOC family protein [Azoarcus sp. KH32C]BAL24276.1 hypothetical protein AZKH_1963 [Azoarcus sp. KH32C]